ncbi:hypothetical protein ACFXAZ_21055 [Streptomyces sp. NPDC059477]
MEDSSVTEYLFHVPRRHGLLAVRDQREARWRSSGGRLSAMA